MRRKNDVLDPLSAGSSRSLAVRAAIFVVVLAAVLWYTAASDGSVAVIARSFLRSLFQAMF